jgi:hypothetical protein
MPCLALAIALLSACGSSSSPPELSQNQDPARQCGNAVRVHDPPDDTRPWLTPEPPNRPPTPPFADLRRFEMSSTAKGVCVRWTTAAPAPVGTQFVFSAHGPPRRLPGGAVASHGYGFELALTDDGGTATFGLDQIGSDAPRVLAARVGQSANTVSAFVARGELDRPPANVPDRPPFPYRTFLFQARVITPPDSEGGQDVDFWPEEGTDAGFIDGHLCPAPCRDQLFQFPEPAVVEG